MSQVPLRLARLEAQTSKQVHIHQHGSSCPSLCETLQYDPGSHCLTQSPWALSEYPAEASQAVHAWPPTLPGSALHLVHPGRVHCSGGARRAAREGQSSDDRVLVQSALCFSLLTSPGAELVRCWAYSWVTWQRPHEQAGRAKGGPSRTTMACSWWAARQTNRQPPAGPLPGPRPSAPALSPPAGPTV